MSALRNVEQMNDVVRRLCRGGSENVVRVKDASRRATAESCTEWRKERNNELQSRGDALQGEGVTR